MTKPALLFVIVLISVFGIVLFFTLLPLEEVEERELPPVEDEVLEEEPQVIPPLTDEEFPTVFIPPKEDHSYSEHWDEDGSIIFDETLAASLNQAGVSFLNEDIEDYMYDDDIRLLFYYQGDYSEDELRNIVVNAGGEFGIVLNMISAFSATVDQKSMAEFVSSVKGSLQIDKIQVSSKFRFTLDEGVPMMLTPEERAELEAIYGAADGANITIAILDTGIHDENPDLDDLDDNPDTHDPKVIAEAEFTGRSVGTDDDYGHGTHCASIAAGTGEASNYQFVGVAPQAYLMNGKVGDMKGITLDGIVAAIYWAVNGPDGILPGEPGDTGDGADVISMSLGGPPNVEIMNIAAQYAVDHGVVVVVAAGNSGQGGYFTIGSPGDAENVITVGAVDKNKERIYFSSKGPTKQTFFIKPEVMAPGVNICAARSKAGYYDQQEDKHYYNYIEWDIIESRCNGDLDCFIERYLVPCGYPNEESTYDIAEYWVLSGTSMSCPHVAGAVALLKQMRPEWTPERIKGAMVNNAEDVGENVYAQGGGLVKIKNAATSDLVVTPSLLNLQHHASDFNFSFTIENQGSTEWGIRLVQPVTIEEVKTSYPKSFELTPFSEIEFCIPATGQQQINGRMEISSWPWYNYGGKIFAEVYSDCTFSQKERDLIIPFGFSKAKKLTVHYHMPDWFLDYANCPDPSPYPRDKRISTYGSHPDMGVGWLTFESNLSVHDLENTVDFVREYMVGAEKFDLLIYFHTTFRCNGYDPMQVRVTTYTKKIDMTGVDELEIWADESDAQIYDLSDVDSLRESHNMVRRYLKFYHIIKGIFTEGYGHYAAWALDADISEVQIAVYAESDSFYADSYALSYFDSGNTPSYNSGEISDFFFYDEYPFDTTRFKLPAEDIYKREVNVYYPFVEQIPPFYFTHVGLVGVLNDQTGTSVKNWRSHGFPFSSTIYFNNPFIADPTAGKVFLYGVYNAAHTYPFNPPNGQIIEITGKIFNPQEKQDSIEFHKTKFKLDITGTFPYKSELLGEDPDKYTGMVYGIIRSENGEAFEGLSVNYGSNLRITTPDGQIFSTDELVKEERFALFDRHVSWRLACSGGSMSALDFPCQDGIYKLSWTLENVVDHTPCLEVELYRDATTSLTPLSKVSGELESVTYCTDEGLIQVETCVPT